MRKHQRRARPEFEPRAGFTLPEVLVALVIVSGLLLATLDALRAFDAGRIRVTATARALDDRRLVARQTDALATTWSADAVHEQAAVAAAVVSRQRLRDTSTAPVQTIRALATPDGVVAAFVVEERGRAVAVAPMRVNAPTPCRFDPVARRCQP